MKVTGVRMQTARGRAINIVYSEIIVGDFLVFHLCSSETVIKRFTNMNDIVLLQTFIRLVGYDIQWNCDQTLKQNK